jgi:hypothetical protein
VALSFRNTPEFGHRFDVLRHGFVGQQTAALHDITDGAAQFHGVPHADAGAINRDLTGGRIDHPVDHSQQGRLSTSTGSDQNGNGPRGNTQGEVLDR